VREINKIILHCSATPEGRDVKAKTIKKWHTEKGWSDVGYHYIIELDGSLKTGRPIDRIGAHCKGHNNNSIGVCYVGGVDANMKAKNTLNEAQRKTLVILLAYLKLIYEASIHGHNEFSSKACPSFDVKDFIKIHKI
jgi:N-acetylmuramoyl-L-alanine amidase